MSEWGKWRLAFQQFFHMIVVKAQVTVTTQIRIFKLSFCSELLTFTGMGVNNVPDNCNSYDAI